jgi:hypothetical protein
VVIGQSCSRFISIRQQAYGIAIASYADGIAADDASETRHFGDDVALGGAGHDDALAITQERDGRNDARARSALGWHESNSLGPDHGHSAGRRGDAIDR